jgi:hypothetical protein
MTTQAIDTDGPVDKEGKALDVNASESIEHDWTDAEERKARLKYVVNQFSDVPRF